MLELWLRYRKYSRLLLVLLASFALLTVQQRRPESQWLVDGVAAVTAPVQMAFARVHRRLQARMRVFREKCHEEGSQRASEHPTRVA